MKRPQAGTGVAPQPTSATSAATRYADPAKRPSIWISKTLVHHTYQKIGEFWLPAQNESTTDVRLGGHATLSIHYTDYRLVANTGPPASEHHPGDRALGLTEGYWVNLEMTEAAPKH